MPNEVPSLTKYIWLSVAAAILTIGLKMGAYFTTGSVGLLSDALESMVNLAAAIAALIILNIAEKPPDDDHAYGHYKAEYFSSGFEGALILIAAATISISAVNRLLHPQPIEQIGLGIFITIIASLINLAVALVLMRAGKQNHSITLEADAHHLFSDVWTSAGVVIGVVVVYLSGFNRLDAIIALIIAVNIIRTGIQLLRRSALGLLDTALPISEREKITRIQERYEAEGVSFHALRTRQSGRRRFISMHVLVPGEWTVLRGHKLLEQLESDVHSEFPNTTVLLPSPVVL